jgi:hypothetical protein
VQRSQKTPHQTNPDASKNPTPFIHMMHQILTQIIAQTPSWVFVLFFVLLALGLLQMRGRSMNLRRVLIMPVVFLALSFAGVVSAFGWHATALSTWGIGYSLTALVVSKWPSSQAASYDRQTRRFSVAGSAMPLALMMGLYFLKYFVGASTGAQATYVSHALFPLCISALYGAFSGAFAGRAWGLLRLVKAA